MSTLDTKNTEHEHVVRVAKKRSYTIFYVFSVLLKKYPYMYKCIKIVFVEKASFLVS